MKLVILAACVQTVAAFSGNYLSQLNGGNTANVASANGAFGVNGGSVASAPAPEQVMATNQNGPSQEMLDLISKQVSVELMASQAYMSASIWFRSRNMDGMAAWMLDESDEERGHGKEILEFAMKNHYPVQLEALALPRSEWQTPDEVWETILSLEQQNTKNLLAIAHAADKCGQYGVKAFLDPFHVEQIEAEDKVGGILAKVRGASINLLWELDYMLGKEAEEEDHH
uniref:Ferritin n=1 Tax=Ditylum brightwellii TaxID=49249 RepID=A0A7S1YZW3_9STRA